MVGSIYHNGKVEALPLVRRGGATVHETIASKNVIPLRYDAGRWGITATEIQ